MSQGWGLLQRRRLAGLLACATVSTATWRKLSVFVRILFVSLEIRESYTHVMLCGAGQEGLPSSVTANVASNENRQRLQELSRAKVKKQLLGDESMIGRFGLGNKRTAAAFAERVGVDFFEKTFVREGWQQGELGVEDFDEEAVLFPESSIEAKISSLNPRAQELIEMFLQVNK